VTGDRRAVFLDRDGTIVRDPGFLRSPDEVRLLPGAGGAIRALREAGYAIVVVTNQSGLARGLLDEATLGLVHARLEHLLRREGAALDGIYWCPHHPGEGSPPLRIDCECRKPKPGLLLRAVAELSLDPGRSFSAGDSPRDLEASLAAKVRFVALGFSDPRASHESPDLAAAARWILVQGR
jgi:D-glycero-D-manno-heptose 1,7-bisphosphate phosphatase